MPREYAVVALMVAVAGDATLSLLLRRFPGKVALLEAIAVIDAVLIMTTAILFGISARAMPWYDVVTGALLLGVFILALFGRLAQRAKRDRACACLGRLAPWGLLLVILSMATGAVCGFPLI